MLWDADKQQFGQLHELNEYLYCSKGRGKYPLFPSISLINRMSDRFADRNVNLMAVFFDVLLLDDEILVYKSYCTRTERLESLITTTPGRVPCNRRQQTNNAKAILPQKFFLRLDSLESAEATLQKEFADCGQRREEGFVLKPSDAPYYASPTWLKLKQDHIPGLGDTLDFCLIGASFDPKRDQNSGKHPQGVKWNVWHVACLENKPDVLEYVTSPFLLQNILIAERPPAFHDNV